jgi:hypothetical protein
MGQLAGSQPVLQTGYDVRPTENYLPLRARPWHSPNVGGGASIGRGRAPLSKMVPERRGLAPTFSGPTFCTAPPFSTFRATPPFCAESRVAQKRSIVFRFLCKAVPALGFPDGFLVEGCPRG